MNFKVQRIRSCIQCKTILDIKCKACVNHPEREPKTIEVYDWPEILAIGPCKCYKIACQRPGCTGTMWRSRTHNRGGKARSAAMYCSQQCCCAMMAKEKDKREFNPCQWCRKPVLRKQSRIRASVYAFCSQEHYFLYRKKKAFLDLESKKAEKIKNKEKKNESARLALLECRKCNEITEHDSPLHGLATCKTCSTKRGQGSSAISGPEIFTLTSYRRIPVAA